MNKKITQRKAALYVLWKAFQENPNEFIPTWRFVGEIHIREVNQHFLMSYKTPANGLGIIFDNPDLVERRLKKGKSGSEYYEYKLISPFNIENIKDPILVEFFEDLTT